MFWNCSKLSGKMSMWKSWLFRLFKVNLNTLSFTSEKSRPFILQDLCSCLWKWWKNIQQSVFGKMQGSWGKLQGSVSLWGLHTHTEIFVLCAVKIIKDCFGNRVMYNIQFKLWYREKGLKSVRSLWMQYLLLYTSDMLMPIFF